MMEIYAAMARTRTTKWAVRSRTGLNYLRKGHHQFFNDSVPYLKALSQIVASGRTPRRSHHSTPVGPQA
jgi:hypothetical protein